MWSRNHYLVTSRSLFRAVEQAVFTLTVMALTVGTLHNTTRSLKSWHSMCLAQDNASCSSPVPWLWWLWPGPGPGFGPGPMVLFCNEESVLWSIILSETSSAMVTRMRQSVKMLLMIMMTERMTMITPWGREVCGDWSVSSELHPVICHLEHHELYQWRWAENNEYWWTVYCLPIGHHELDMVLIVSVNFLFEVRATMNVSSPMSFNWGSSGVTS